MGLGLGVLSLRIRGSGVRMYKRWTKILLSPDSTPPLLILTLSTVVYYDFLGVFNMRGGLLGGGD